MIELAYMALFVLGAFSLGDLLLNRKDKFDSFMERFVFGAALGYVLLSLLTFISGIFGLLYKPVFFTIFVLLLVMLLFRIKEIYQGFANDMKNFRKIKPYLYFGMIFIILIFVILNLISSMAPVYGWDVLIYHLSLPKLSIAAHKLVYSEHIFESTWPLGVQMLYLLGMGIKNDIFAKLIANSFSILMVLGLMSFGKRHYSLKAGIISALVYLMIPLVIEYGVLAYVDIPVAFFSFIAVYAFINWIKTDSISWLVLCAVFSGMNVASKFPGLIMLAVIAIAVSVKLLFDKKSKISQKIGMFVVFGALSAVIFLPYYIRAFFLTGNPVFPYFYSVFGGRFWSMGIEAVQHSYFAGRYDLSLVNYILLPWFMTMNSRLFNNLLGLGPVFLGFIPILFLLKWKDITTKALLWIVFGFTVLWVVLPLRNLRHYSVFSLLVVLAGYSIYQILAVKKLKWITILFLISMVIFASAISLGIKYRTGQIKAGLGLISKEKFITGLSDHNNYKAFEYINDNLDDNDVVFLFMENRGYYLDIGYVVGHSDQGYVDYTTIDNIDEFKERLKQIGVTHIMVNDVWLDELYSTVYDKSFFDHAFMLKDELIEDAIVVYEDKETKVYGVVY